MKRILLFALFLPFMACSQPKGKADELYEKYDPKPYVSGFSFGGSLLSALPIDIDFTTSGDLEKTLNGEIKRIQWLKVNDDRYLAEVTKDWERFLKRTGYHRVAFDNDDDENYVYIRGSRTRFDEAHFVIKEENMTMLLTVYGDFTLNKKLHED